jgi:IMP dehydrogenase/GMP reductase
MRILFITNYKDRIEEIGHHYYICVDIANGHMKSLYDKCKQAKELARDNNYKLTIMTGNIANAETYEWICKNAIYQNKDDYNVTAIDYIRCGIGGGCGCITSSNVSIHYPQASLIDECRKVKDWFENCYDRKVPAIIADGGIRNYDHVIKALALGADYVMIGSLFAQCIESAGIKYTGNDNSRIKFNYNSYECNSLKVNEKDEWVGECIYKWDDPDIDEENNYIGKMNVKFFGMASSDGQKSISGKKTKTSEGITKYLPVKYTLSGWIENMISYLRSAMSYCDCFDITEFICKPKLIKNSISEINAVNK